MRKLFYLSALLLASVAMNAAVITVPSGSDLQAAINGASSGDQVKVQAGTFTGNFTMKDGVQVSGGWDANFETQTEYGTILDANANGRVLDQVKDFTTLTIWENFTIQNGNLKAIDGSKSLGSGVALFKNGRIVKCLVQNNTYSYSGNCLGGGLGNDSGAAGDIMADSCIIRNNKASHGGGVRIRGTIQNSIIEDNLTEANAAGGVHLQSGRIYNCIVRNNTGKDTGGARLYGGCEMINCLVYGNTGKGSIGGVSWENGGAAKIINNTIVYNNQEGTDSPSRCGFRAAAANASAIFANNIVFGNKVQGEVNDEQCQGVTTTIFTGANAIVNNAVYNATIGVNGIDLKVVDPGFMDAANNDFSLLETSLLVNKGDKTKNTTTKDLAGKQRVRGGLIDLGCYEYQSPESRNTYVKVGDNLQDSINLTVAGYTVYVQAGTFTGNFTMKDGVNVSGGWDAEFKTQTDYATILDAQGSGRVVNQPENFSVLTTWSNLTIQGGLFTTAQTDKMGSGVALCNNGQVNHCKIQNNHFTGTSGECNGGGVAHNSGVTTQVLVDDCWILNNSASHGGGVRIQGVIQNSIIENNTTSINACGGAQLHGGSMYNCIVRNNKGKDTGGVRMTGNNGYLCNCLIYGNEAEGSIGGVSIEGLGTKAINNTIVNNNQVGTGNAARCGLRVSSSANNGNTLQNNIIWGNKVAGTVNSSQIQCDFTTVYTGTNAVMNNAVYNSSIGANGIKLTTANPGFKDMENGDFSLIESSSLVNAGYNNAAAGTKDLAGAPRKVNTIDIGAYECQTQAVDNYVLVGEDLQAAINKTFAGFTVYVQAGTFTGNFIMKDGVNVSGGWNADFTAQTDYATVLDAQGEGRVLDQVKDFATKTIWSNFTIQNGKLTAKRADQGGSGVYLYKNGQVKHCLIQYNTFDYQDNCLGGGVGNNSVINNNEVLIDDCIIRNNCATHGGGICICGTIQNSIIENNNTKDVKAGPAGGAHLQGGRMVNCIVRNNTSGGDTGGVRLYGKCQLIGSLIANNTATNTVGGVGIESANSDVIGNTIVCNEELKDQDTPSKCGLSCGATDAANGILSNNVIWGNKHRGVVQDAQIYYVSHYDNRDYNAVNKQTTNREHSVALNPDNMAADGPHFTDPENGDFTILSTSVLVEGGDNTLATASKDLAGNNRIINGHVDYGCYEYTGAATLLNEKEESEFEEGETDVVMRRSFVADGSYYTLALPFAMSQEQIATVFGACQISELESSILKSETAEHMELRLNFKNVQTIEANKPYLFLPAQNITNPIFEGVTLSKTANDVLTDYADMKSILTPTTFEGLSDGAFFLGTDNILHPLDTEKSTVNAYRAYFELHSLEAVGGPKAVCARVSINGAPTELGQWNKDKGQRTIKVLRDGQLMIIRDNKTYNAQGNLVE